MRYRHLFERFDYSTCSQDAFVRMLDAEGCVVPGAPPQAEMSSDNYEWHFDPHYPLARVAPPGGGFTWAKWMQAEIIMWGEEGEPHRYDDMFDRPIRDPIFLVEVAGKGWMWDGCHRVGASEMTGRTTLPAIVGLPSNNITEAFNSVQPWKEVYKGAGFTRYDFKVGTAEVYVTICGDGLASVQFGVCRSNNKGSEMGVTGGGDALTIFSTVFDIVLDYLRNHPTIDELYFAAKKNQPSRIKMYRALQPRLEKLGWSLHREDADYTDETTWLYRREDNRR